MKYCTHCGAELLDGATFCTKCGCKTNVPTETTSQPKCKRKINAYALVGFILAMVSVITFHRDFLGLMALAAMALSIVGLVQIHKDNVQRGKGFAIAGMVVGAYYVIIGLLYWIDYLIKV